MPVTLIGTRLSDADSSTGWSGVTNIDTDSETQGTGCLGTKVSNATTATMFSSTQDLSDGRHVVMWLNCLTPTLNTKANGGLRIRLNDGNDSDWYVGGEDNRKAGWGAYVVDPQSTPDSGTHTPSATSSIGGVISTQASIMGNFNNGLWDSLTVGEGLRWTGAGGTLNDFLAADEGDSSGGRWGWITSVASGKVKFPQCKLICGDGSTTSDMLFDAQTIIFEDAPVSDTFYEISVTANASLSILNGTNISTAGVKLWTLDLSAGSGVVKDSTLDKLLSATLSSGSTFERVKVSNSGILDANGCTLLEATFVGAVGTFAVTVGDLALLDKAVFTKGTAGHAVELTGAAGSYSWDCITSGYDAGVSGDGVEVTGGSITGDEDIHITATTGTFTISVEAGATIPSVSSAGAVVNVVSGLVTLSVVTQDGNEVRIRQGSYTLHHVQNVSGGQEDYTYTYTPNTKVTVTVGASGYSRRTERYTLSSSNATLLMTLDPNPSYI